MMRVATLALMVSFSSCAYIFSRGEYVIERSKSQTPDWTDLEANKFIADEEEYRFHFISKNYDDLPLGLKKAQQESLDTSEINLKILIDQMLTQKLNAARVREVSSIKQYQDLFDAVVKDAYKGSIKIQDIYFEKLRRDEARSNELQEFYRVHTLQTISKVNLDMLLRDLATRCVKTQNPMIRKFGSDANPGAIKNPQTKK